MFGIEDVVNWQIHSVHVYHGHRPLVIRAGNERDRARQSNVGTLVLDGVPGPADLHVEVQVTMGTESRIRLAGVLLTSDGDVLFRRSIDIWVEPGQSDLARIDFEQVTFKTTGIHSLLLLVDSVPVGEPVRFDVTVPAVPATVPLRLPNRCPQCGSTGTVRHQQVLSGGEARMNWICVVCRTEWPIAPEEYIERRAATSDRRRTARKDRRFRSG